jgi:hypothetical protein
MDLASFLAHATSSFPNDGDIRYGQHWFNRLYEVRPDLAGAIRGTRLDPFHEDNVSQELLSYVVANWG